MQCKKCGTQIKEECLFCHNCGEEVQIVPDYEPELEDLQIGIIKEDEELLVSLEEAIPNFEENDLNCPEKEKHPAEHEKEEKKDKKTFLSKKWILIFSAIVLLLGIVAFAFSYGAVLQNQDPDAMQDSENSSEDDVKTYVVKPKFSLPGGEYTYYISVELKVQNKETIFYTLDGTTPDETSNIYKKPIELGEGTTVIRAFAMDENGNCSDIVSDVYVVEFGAPDAPTVFPESGEYYGEQYIRIVVPDGCMAYYTLDGSAPTESSEIYSGEFLMPEGDSMVQVVLVNQKGMMSEISTVYYHRTQI